MLDDRGPLMRETLGLADCQSTRFMSVVGRIASSILEGADARRFTAAALVDGRGGPSVSQPATGAADPSRSHSRFADLSTRRARGDACFCWSSRATAWSPWTETPASPQGA